MNPLPLAAAALSLALLSASCREAQMPLPPESSPAATAPAAAVEAPVTAGSPPPAEVSIEMGGICNIEAIGDLTGPALNAPVRISGESVVAGWRTLQAQDGSEAGAWLRVLGADGAVAQQVSLPATEDRPDVVASSGRESALRSGFRQASISGLAAGTYTVDIVFDAGPEWVRCAHTRTLAVE